MSKLSYTLGLCFIAFYAVFFTPIKHSWDIVDWIFATLSLQSHAQLSDSGAPWGLNRKCWQSARTGGDFDPIMEIPPWMTLWSDSVFPHSIDLFSFILYVVFSHSNSAPWSHPLRYDIFSVI